MSEQDIAVKKQQITPAAIGCTLGVASTAGIIDVAAHLGPNGLLAGAILSLIAYRHGEDIVNGVRDRIPQPILDAMTERFGRKSHMVEQRVNPKEEQASLQDDEETQVLDAAIDVTPNATVYYAPDDEETLSLPINTAAASGSLFRFSELLDAGFVPTINKIFVGRTMDGKDIFVTAKDLCHVALAGKTGGGKGSLMRLLMVQLCYIGAKVLLLNSHYMRWVCADAGPEFDEDWTPFEGINKRTGKPYLEASPSDSAEVKAIERCLIWAVETLLEKRKVEGREGGKRFSPYFIVIDEWPAVAKKIKDGPDHLAELLREGRKFGIFVIVASQDFQVKTIGMDSGSVRKCLLTCFYTGGDTTTARELLYEKGQDIPENKVGKGVVMLRCVGTKNEATLAKVPFVDNDAVYRLLGPSTFHGAKQAVVVEEPEAPLPQATVPVPAPSPAVPSQSQQVSGDLTSAIERIVALYEAGKLDQDTMFQLIDRLPGVQPAQETSQQASHLRLVSKEAVEDEFYAQETERLPETQRAAKGFSRSLSPELQTTYNAFQPGMSNRDLGRLLNIDQSTAGRHVRFLIDKGAISHDRQRKLIG